MFLAEITARFVDNATKFVTALWLTVCDVAAVQQNYTCYAGAVRTLTHLGDV